MSDLEDQWAELRVRWAKLKAEVWAERWSLGLCLFTVWVGIAAVAVGTWGF